MFLFQATAVPAQTTSAPATQAVMAVPTEQDAQNMGKPQTSPWGSVGFMILLFVILYFLMIRPNQKREKQRKEKLASLTEGDKVVTIGGIKGTVISVKEDTVTIKSKTTELDVVKQAISHIIR